MLVKDDNKSSLGHNFTSKYMTQLANKLISLGESLKLRSKMLEGKGLVAVDTTNAVKSLESVIGGLNSIHDGVIIECKFIVRNKFTKLYAMKLEGLPFAWVEDYEDATLFDSESVKSFSSDKYDLIEDYTASINTNKPSINSGPSKIAYGELNLEETGDRSPEELLASQRAIYNPDGTVPDLEKFDQQSTSSLNDSRDRKSVV